tara:strand:- start:4529 stop:4672 length:144 start_codon:yes stop_codon:yes gene_type:complete
MKLHHIGIVVNDLEKTAKMMNEFFNNNDSKILSNKIQKVNYCFIDLG